MPGHGQSSAEILILVLILVPSSLVAHASYIANSVAKTCLQVPPVVAPDYGPQIPGLDILCATRAVRRGGRRLTGLQDRPFGDGGARSVLGLHLGGAESLVSGDEERRETRCRNRFRQGDVGGVAAWNLDLVQVHGLGVVRVRDADIM